MLLANAHFKYGPRFGQFHVRESLVRYMRSGDSRMKKLGGALRGQGKNVRGQHKCLSCMVIFHCNEDWFAMIKPMKPNKDL